MYFAEVGTDAFKLRVAGPARTNPACQPAQSDAHPPYTLTGGSGAEPPLGLIIGLVIGLITFCMKESSLGIFADADSAALAYQTIQTSRSRPTVTLMIMIMRVR